LPPNVLPVVADRKARGQIVRGGFRAQGKPPPQRLGQRQRVGHEAVVLVREEAARP
jgi:hypothetical protein